MSTRPGPTRPRRPAEDSVKRQRVGSLGTGLRKLVAAVAGLATLFFTGVAEDIVDNLKDRFGVDEVFRPPSVQEELAKLRSSEEQSGHDVTVSEPLELHDSASRSYFVQVRQANQRDVPEDRLESDEVRVYDVIDDRLTLAFEFQPQFEGPVPIEFPASFRYEGDMDIDGDGEHELVGSFVRFSVDAGTAEYGTGEFDAPVIIWWNSLTDEYELAAVPIGRPPRWSTQGSLARNLHERLYAQTESLNAVGDGKQLDARFVEDYAWVTVQSVGVLLTGYVVSADFWTDRPQLKIVGWVVRHKGARVVRRELPALRWLS